MTYAEACEALHLPLGASPEDVRVAYKLWMSKWVVHEERTPYVYAGAVAKLREARSVAEFAGRAGVDWDGVLAEIQSRG